MAWGKAHRYIIYNILLLYRYNFADMYIRTVWLVHVFQIVASTEVF